MSPSVREGGNISLQEAIWHEVPFLTTDVPGCKVLADEFGCPAVKMNEFGNAVLAMNIANLPIANDDWRKKIEPFSEASVSIEYEAILQQIVGKK